jgi:hypothetical protein
MDRMSHYGRTSDTLELQMQPDLKALCLPMGTGWTVLTQFLRGTHDWQLGTTGVAGAVFILSSPSFPSRVATAPEQAGREVVEAVQNSRQFISREPYFAWRNVPGTRNYRSKF